MRNVLGSMTYNFVAYIERDPESQLFVGHVPNLPGAHTQAETLDELHANLKEVTVLCLESLSPEEIADLNLEFIGTQQLSIEV